MFRSTTCFGLLILGVQAATAQDTLVVRANNPPVWGERPRLVEQVRIGTLDGDVNYALSAVGGVVVLDDGTIWVGDRHLSAIRRFDADGLYVDQIGRKGEGPGEFVYPFGMRLLPDGSVVIWDDGQIRISRFDAGGNFLGSFQPPTFMIHGPYEELEVDPDGNLYVIAMTDPTKSPRRLFWIKMRPDGQILDSLYFESPRQEGTIDPIRTITALSPLGYLVTARTDKYALHRTMSDGRVVRIERSWSPIEYQRAERSEKERLERGFSERNGRPRRPIPKDKPPISYFQVDQEGRFWVQLHRQGYVEAETPGEQERRERYDGLLREWREPVVFEIIEPEGRYLGRIEFPNRQTTVILARDRLVWVVEKGAFDEPYVVRYLIEPAG